MSYSSRLTYIYPLTSLSNINHPTTHFTGKTLEGKYLPYLEAVVELNGITTMGSLNYFKLLGLQKTSAFKDLCIWGLADVFFQL